MRQGQEGGQGQELGRDQITKVLKRGTMGLPEVKEKEALPLPPLPPPPGDPLLLCPLTSAQEPPRWTGGGALSLIHI